MRKPPPMIVSAQLRERLGRLSDWLAVMTAVSLPWSTSATSILIVLWLLALIPTLRWPDVRPALLTAAGGLPVMLVLLGAIGMLWADVSLIERLRGLESFLKLLLIPLLFVQFRTLEKGMWVFGGYLASCGVLVLASYALALMPGQDTTSVFFGVPVKNAPAQSGELVTCIFGLIYLAYASIGRRQWVWGVALSVAILAMFGNIVFVATGRTALAVAVVLLVVFAMTRLSFAGVLILFAAAAVLASLAWFSSPYLRGRTEQIWTDLRAYEATKARNSSGERVEFAEKSIAFIRSAPVIGHGTGSIHQQFVAAAGGREDPAQAGTNPHNQTFAVGIQLGIVGIAVLWAMWIAQLILFQGSGLAAWVGLLLVVQNIVGSLFNSHLFDFLQGWTYVIGVGVAGGIVLQQRARETTAGASAQPS